MRIIECVQGSPDWWDARKGIPTASNFHRILTAAQQKYSAQAADYIAELIADCKCLCPPFFTERGGHTAEMRNGQNYEPEARRYYEMERGLDVQQVGFITTDEGLLGCSPDGVILDKGEMVGGLELKCPLLKTHAAYLLKGKLPDDYKAQCHGALIVTGLPWWDFMSYAPGLPPLLIRVEPNDFTVELRKALTRFLAEYQAALAFIEGRSLAPVLEASIKAGARSGG